MDNTARTYRSKRMIFADVRSNIFFLCNITSLSFKNRYENKKQCGYGFTKVVKQVCQYVIAELRINGREMSRYKWLSAVFVN